VANGLLASPTPLLRQVPIAVIFTVAVLLSVTLPNLVVTNVTALVSGLAVMAIATAAAAAAGRWHAATLGVLVPALDFVAIGVLRFATGVDRSVFVSLVVLPVVWFAVEAGRRYIVYAFVGVCVVLLLPFLLGGDRAVLANELVRSAISAASFGIAAAIINEVSKQARLRLEAMRSREEAASTELENAAEMQRSLLPPPGRPLEGWSIAGVCVPSKVIGGDFFDWYGTQEGMAFTIGDVMGKGAAAGLIAATVRAVVRSARALTDPRIALSRASNMLTTELGGAVVFTTLFHARVSAIDGVVSYSDGGHGLALVVRADGSKERLVSDGLPVGIVLDGGWTTRTIVLEPGDMIVVFSDGVLDLYDGSLIAIDAVADLARRSEDPQSLVDVFAEESRARAVPDDVTVVAIRREPIPAHVTARRPELRMTGHGR
jgi:serine phosphatase RsbU (regulator of sigma subunit)